MHLWFARGGGISIRDQLVTQLMLAMASGELPAGKRLPSTRALARRFQLHPNTVMNEWRNVEQLRPGTPVSVVAGRDRQECELVSVTDSELVCNRDIGRVNRRLVYARGPIREVRLEMPERNTMIAGAIAGGIAGGLLGFFGTKQAADPETHGYATYYGVPIGAFIGGLTGRHFHRHGAVVYRA